MTIHRCVSKEVSLQAMQEWVKGGITIAQVSEMYGLCYSCWLDGGRSYRKALASKVGGPCPQCSRGPRVVVGVNDSVCLSCGYTEKVLISLDSQKGVA